MKFEILNITNKDDITCSLSVSYDKDFENVVKKYYNKKEITEKDVQRFVYDAINLLQSGQQGH